MSPERGGTLTVLVAGEGEAQRAADILEAQGYGVVVTRGDRGLMKVEPAASLEGHFAVPGDKSISHRALLLGAVSDGDTVVRGWGRSADTESTLAAVRALGVEVGEGGDQLTVQGVGLRGLESAEIDCGNAGTLARLLPGLLAFQDGTFTLTGDESLSARPMERIAEPLRRMGAQVETTDGPSAADDHRRRRSWRSTTSCRSRARRSSRRSCSPGSARPGARP